MSRSIPLPARRCARGVLAFLFASTLTLSAARADDAVPPPATLPPVVVSATRVPTPESEVASSVTVITSQDIESKQQRTVPDLLRDVPGLNVVQTGGPGGVTSVFMRGTNSNHTKVLIDGVDASDPTSADGSFDFAHLLTSDIERIEVLRGPQSGLYGSDAIGGVINIITKSGTGPGSVTGSVEGGSFGTFNQAGSASGAVDRFNYALNIAHSRTSDSPVTPLNLLPPGRSRIDDSYDNQTYSTKLGATLTDNFDVGLVVRYVDTALRFTGDDFSVFPSVPAAEQSESDTRQLFTRGTAHQVLFDGVFDQTFGVGFTDYRRRDISPGTEPSFNRGDRVKFDWQGNIKVLPGQIVTLGAERQLDEIRNSPISAQTTTNAGLIQLQSSFIERLFNTISLRYDDNDRFGGKATYREAPAFLILETGTKLKGSVGTGFKAPSLEDLFVSFPAFNFFANPNLKPEESLGYDVGFEQLLASGRVQFGATYFHNDITNLIAPNDASTTNINIARATTYGVESFVADKPFDQVTVRGDYTYTIATDDIAHDELLRRPKHKASASVHWQATDALSLTATTIYVGSWIDGNRDFSIPRLHAGSYALVNLAGSYELGDGVTAFARIDNLLNRRYEDPVGFQRPGLGIFAGLKVAFDAAGPGR
jgi:vitamin B12 transporter